MNSILMSRSCWLARLDFFLALLLNGIRRRQSFQAVDSSQAGGAKIFVESSDALLQKCVRISRDIMKAFVTGASGFIGSNLVHELVAQGHHVKALLRPNSDKRGLAGVEFERVTGDVFDRKLLEREMEGCDWCFHVAASYHLWLRDYKPMYAVNIEGTRNVLEAAGKVGCGRIVYTSTVGCVGLPKRVAGRLVPSTELDAITNEQLSNHYKCSKWQAELLATKRAGKGE